MQTYISEEKWTQQYNDVLRALEPWVIEIDDHPFISPSAPRGLLDLYLNLQDLGRFKGWL